MIWLLLDYWWQRLILLPMTVTTVFVFTMGTVKEIFAMSLRAYKAAKLFQVVRLWSILRDVASSSGLSRFLGKNIQCSTLFSSTWVKRGGVRQFVRTPNTYDCSLLFLRPWICVVQILESGSIASPTPY